MKRKPVKDESLQKGDSKEMKYDDDKKYDADGKEKEDGEYRMEKGKVVKCDTMKKAEDLTENDLEKSLNRLTEYASEGDTVSRKEELLSKAGKEDLEKSEREELFEILGGETPSVDEEDDSLTKSFKENDTLQKALDVSDFLREQNSELCKSLDMLSDRQNEGDKRQHEFNLMLSKAIVDVGNLVKSMSDSMEDSLSQPARAPKSKGLQGNQVMQKSFAGEQETAKDQLSKAQVIKQLEDIMHETMEKSQGESKLENGVDMLVEISKFEQTGMLHPAVNDMVKERVKGQHVN